MRRPLRTTLAAAATTMLLLGGVTACASDAEKASDEPEIAANEDEAVDSIDLPDDGSEVEPEEFTDWMLEGLERSTTAQMTMTTDTGGAGTIEAEGQVDYEASPVEMAMTMNFGMLGEDPMDMRIVDGVMYLNMGAMSNGKFFEFDLSDPENLPPGMEDLGDQMDPLAAFRDFGPALEKVVFVGTEDLDGDDLHHFTLTMDTTKLPSMQDMPTESGMPQLVDYDLWFDDDFRMRQMDMTMDMMMKVTVQAKIFDWDEPVTIEAPAADQISDAPMRMAG